jgi:hypothetical protein
MLFLDMFGEEGNLIGVKDDTFTPKKHLLHGIN